MAPVARRPASYGVSRGSRIRAADAARRRRRQSRDARGVDATSVAERDVVDALRVVASSASSMRRPSNRRRGRGLEVLGVKYGLMRVRC